MPISVRDVAERAGVSLGTVSNVLNSPTKVSPATAARVRAAIDELGFIRNDAAAALRTGYSQSIGLIVLDVRNPFFADLARGVEQRAAAEDLMVLIANSDERPDREVAYLDSFTKQRVRGILISPVEETIPALQRLRDRGIPSVLVDRLSSTPGWSSVSVDDELGGRLAAEHLLQRGRRRLLFVGGPLDLAQVRDRIAGARAAVEAAGASIEVWPIGSLTMQQGVVAGRSIIEHLDRFDAVFAANDLIALGILQAALYAGVQIPDQLALVGYDDIEYAATAAVPITSIHQPRERLGARALEVLLNEIDGGAVQQIVMQPHLVPRASTLGLS